MDKTFNSFSHWFVQTFPNRSWPLLCALLFSVTTWLMFIVKFGKLDATWWGISIFVFGFCLIAFVCVILWALKLFTPNSIDPLPTWVLWSVVIYYVLSIAGGLFFTQAEYNGGIPRSELAQERAPIQNYHDDNYHHSRTGGFVYSYIFVNNSRPSYSGSSSSGGSLFKCSGKGCNGVGIVVLLLILIVFLFASACLPHFWVVGGLLAIVLLIFFINRAFRE